MPEINISNDSAFPKGSRVDSCFIWIGNLENQQKYYFSMTEKYFQNNTNVFLSKTEPRQG